MKVLYKSQRSYPELNYEYQPSYTDVDYKDIKYNTSVVKIGCDTCHDWTNGNIHYDVTKRRDVQKEVVRDSDSTLNRFDSGKTSTGHSHSPTEDPNHNSELCISCHTSDHFNYDRDGISAIGYVGIQGANPSRYIREYPRNFTGYKLDYPIGDEEGLMETTGIDRLGTHAAQLRVVEDESYSGKSHKNRLSWVYWKYWGDTTQSERKRSYDPYYIEAHPEDTTCGLMLSRKRSRWGQRFDSFKFEDLLSNAANGKNINLFNKEADQDNYRPVIICQSCHTPHFAAAGLVEYNSGAAQKEATPHTALLYATQAESFMCRVCHVNGGNVAHPVHRPTRYNEPTNGSYRASEDNKYFNSMDIVADTTSIIFDGGGSVRRGIGLSDTMHRLVLTREYESVRYVIEKKMGVFHLRDTTAVLRIKNDKGDILKPGQIWRVSDSHGPLKPANYPRAGGSLNNYNYEDKNLLGLPGQIVDTTTDYGGSPTTHRSRLVCDSCHAPHSAGTPMGTYILEGHDSCLPVAYGSNSAGSKSGFAQGSMDGAAQPSQTDDEPTCILCHPQ
ncbi:MAG: hypothetical protein HY934_10560 [Candidatus Firestonebacteria bacterium]|nr:hypothetical protein [Candidatus Firestonebacteria bacterium]